MRMLLGIACLTLMWFVCGTGSAQPKEAPLPRGVLPRTVPGHGETVDAARKAAVSKAVDEVAAWMVLNELKSYKVTEDFVRKNALVDDGHAGKDLAVENIVNPFKAWVVTFKESDWWKELERRDHQAARELRAEHRQTVGSRVIIGLGLLLLAGFGYVRLDEFTQRRYTAWLRLAGAGVATTLLAGWWWMFFQAPG
jgi:hypothetical protein